MTKSGDIKRPAPVNAFETVSILAIASSVAFGGFFEGGLIDNVLILCVNFWLVFKVSRKRSSAARIALTVLAALSYVSLVALVAWAGLWGQIAQQIAARPTVYLTAFFVCEALAVAQLMLLWHPATTHWIRGRESQSVKVSA